uniref:Uncharacterized protein n=1 Tax=Picea sitchensis TaxID=3332 RepID=A0A6B9XTU5_PICSI|nr:hypothetical protein Q903MT_gene5513 [Picea sitchensis]
MKQSLFICVLSLARKYIRGTSKLGNEDRLPQATTHVLGSWGGYLPSWIDGMDE